MHDDLLPWAGTTEWAGFLESIHASGLSLGHARAAWAAGVAARGEMQARIGPDLGAFIACGNGEICSVNFKAGTAAVNALDAKVVEDPATGRRVAIIVPREPG